MDFTTPGDDLPDADSGPIPGLPREAVTAASYIAQVPQLQLMAFEGSAFLTEPKEAVEFVRETRCDSLVAAVGLYLNRRQWPFTLSLLEHVIPINWDNVVL